LQSDQKQPFRPISNDCYREIKIITLPFIMASKFIVGVIGPGENATPDDNNIAYLLGKAIAQEGWVTLTGGRSFGVMDAALKGASEAKGQTIGILSSSNPKGSSLYADIKIVTGMGSGRNLINILTSNVIVVVGMSPGTASEVGLAIKHDRRIILLCQDELTEKFFKKIGDYKILQAQSVQEVIKMTKDYLSVNRVHA
jgi:uncharacterized protein (TIGR00725 family)